MTPKEYEEKWSQGEKMNFTIAKKHDPLKELEEWAETQKLLSRLANSGPHRTSASVYNECYQEFCNHVLAKIAEMRENKK